MDVIVQDDEPRWRKLLVADMDSTIIDQECIDELADYAGLKDRVARITDSAMHAGLSPPASTTYRIVTIDPAGTSVTSRIVAVAVRLEPTRTGAGKRTLFSP